MNIAKKRQDALKTTSKNVAHNTADTTGEFIGNKIAYKILKPKAVHDENLIHIEEIFILPEKKRRNIERMETSTIQM